MNDIKSRSSQLFDTSQFELTGVDVQSTQQADHLTAVLEAAQGMDFPLERSDSKRYHYVNTFFGYWDAAALYGMIRLHRPKRIVEIGSGFSSALMLDACDEMDDYSPNLTFIEPFPDRLLTLTRGERDKTHIIQKFVQDTDKATFDQLESGDFLFIDSSHVSKIGSDVNYLFFEVIPQLPPGVFVHVHDVMWPFEYPEDWVTEGRAWNEAYLLRALLTNNPNLKIYLHLSYVNKRMSDQLQKGLPPNASAAHDHTLVHNGTGIWLRTC